MRDKQLHTADEDLYFAIDERGNVADLTERGPRRTGAAHPAAADAARPGGRSEAIEDDAGLEDAPQKHRPARNACTATTPRRATACTTSASC